MPGTDGLFRFLRRLPPWLPAVAAAAAARLHDLGARSLWVDEAFAAGLVGRSFGDIASMSLSGSPHPPLAFFSIKLSSMLFGTTEAGLRAVPLILSVLAVIPLFSLVSRWVGGRGAFWAAMIWALAPFAVSLGQEAWLYSQMAFLCFLLVDLCDRAWRGSRRALVPAVLTAVAGMATNALFAIAVLVAWLLRIPAAGFRKPAGPLLALLAVVVLTLPVTISTAGQASLRRQRMEAAGFYEETPRRILMGSIEVLSSLIPDGMAPPISRDSLERPRNAVFVAGFLLLQAGCLAVLLTRREIRPGFRIWALACTILPLCAFIFEWPTVRHLSILWVPLALSLGAAAARWRPAGPLLAAAAMLTLLFYMSTTTYPYHGSDWREAVRTVEEGLEEGDAVLIAAGQSGGLAYEFYRTNDAPYVSACAADPYDVQPIRATVDTAGMLDSLLAGHPRVWIIGDFWGGSTALDIAAGRTIVMHRWVSPASEVALVTASR
ncbi:MAG: glycosyltransferase family 39 protein [Candidatus Fermentibacter sp.]|nr:glycosyltransferase family 39 protein [Candidatus Fermentibacter sp.]